MLKLRHYYHLYADGDYREIVHEHFKALRISGLLGRLDHLHVGLVGSATNVATAARRLKKLVPHSFTVSSAASGWEQETQDVLYRDAAEAKEVFLALYAHTKGASSKNVLNELWRRTMTRHTVREWRRAIDAITGDVGACGCFWAPYDNGRLIGHLEGTRYFAGTFWWARSDAIAAIGPPDRGDRYDAEKWIGKITMLPDPYAVTCLFDAPLEPWALQRHLNDVRAAEVSRLATELTGRSGWRRS